MRLTSANLQNMQPFYGDAIGIVHDRSNELFASRGSNVEKNPKWPPLTPKVLKARSQRWGYYKQAPSRPAPMRWT